MASSTTTPRPADLHWAGTTGLAVASIVTSVVLIGALAPDMVSGSEHQRLPLAALVSSFWGTGAIVAAIVAMARLRRIGRPAWLAFATTTATVWAAATVLALAAPTVETGSDPTVIPVAAVLAPIGATFATVVAGVVLTVAGAVRGSWAASVTVGAR